MKKLLLTILVTLLSCAPSKTPLEPVYEAEINPPVVQIIIVDGDTIYLPNQ